MLQGVTRSGSSQAHSLIEREFSVLSTFIAKSLARVPGRPGRLLRGSLQTKLGPTFIAVRIERYMRSGRRPWSVGYKEYKARAVRDALHDGELLARFAGAAPLPPGYGVGLDERIVEYPWVLARLASANHRLLDAGSALNQPWLLELPVLRTRRLVVYTLAPETVVSQSNVSYVYGDLRDTILRSESFDEIVCISTLEHVGMDNTRLYSTDPRFAESKPDDWRLVVGEFKRLLAPGGRLFVTVPYGRYRNLGWLQQFDGHLMDRLLETFRGFGDVNTAYYAYRPAGWELAESETCADCEYYDVHSGQAPDPDGAAAARAVACVEVTRSRGPS